MVNTDLEGVNTGLERIPNPTAFTYNMFLLQVWTHRRADVPEGEWKPGVMRIPNSTALYRYNLSPPDR